MTKQEAFDAMIGLYAYDSGCVDSGIHDNVLKGEARDFVRAELEKPENEHRIFPRFMDRLVREEFLSDRALQQGYGCEDVRTFLDWFAGEMW